MIGKPASSEGDALVEVSAATRRWSERRERRPSPSRRSFLVLVGVVALLAVATVYHYAIYVPQPDVPHRLTLLDDVFALGVFGLVGLVGLVLGQRVLRPFRLAGFSRLERGALAVGLGWGLLSLGVLALGLAHLFYGWLLMAGLVVVLLCCWRDVWRIFALLASAAPYRRLQAMAPQGLFLRALGAIIALEMILLGMQSLTLPFYPRGIDVYQYHWSVPELYLLRHAIYALPGWAHANFPFNSEMLNTLALVCDSPIAAVFIQAAFGLLAIVLIGGFLYRRFGALAAWLGVALSLCNNLVAGVLISGYAEPASSYYAVASLVIALAWLEQDEPSAGRGLLLLAGLFGGLGLGVKYTVGQTLVGIAVLLIGVGIARSVRLRLQGKPCIAMLRRFVLALLGYGATALLALLPWLLKDWVLLGNPIYPFVWGGPEWDAARTEVGVVTFSHFGPQGSFPERLLTGFFLLFRFNGTEQTDEPFPIPPNYLYVLALLIPLILLVGWLLRRKRRSSPFSEKEERVSWGQSWLVVAGVGYLLWLLSGAAVARYALPWALLLSVPSAVLLARLAQARWKQSLLRQLAPATRILTKGAVLLAAMVALVYTGPGWSDAEPLQLISGNVSLHQLEERTMLNIGYWHMVEYVEQHIPHEARLLLVGEGASYFLSGFDYVADSGEDWIPYLETEGHTSAGMVALLRQDHFRYLVYDSVVLSFVVRTYGNHYLASFLPAFRQFLAGSLQQVWSYQNFHVYQVPSP